MFDSFFIGYNLLYIFLFLISIALCMSISEVLKKLMSNTHEEVLRKIPHILIGILFSITPFFFTTPEIILISTLLFLGVFVSDNISLFTASRTQRKSYGKYLSALSLGVMAYLWLPENTEAFIFGILVITFSDALAALAGRLWGNKTIANFPKTYLGTFVFFVTTLFIALLLAPGREIFALVGISLVLTVVEFFAIRGTDNILLPVIAAYLFYFFL